ncbi:MAG: hypothetical protein HY242_05780 [Afipia sp.]|nr:hypothetical protein [Afipia sp.]
MAKNPKIKDPTEVAMSAIQDALSIDSPKSESGRRSSLRRDTTSLPLDLRADDDGLQPSRFARPANDDREAIGEMLQTIQKGRPRRSAYTVASIFAGLWILAGGILTFLFMPALESIAGQEGGGALALIGLAGLFLAPLILFYFMAMLAWRSQELSLIAQSMAQMAMRFSEPEKLAGDSMVSVGQAIRREVAAMGDGVERAIARAGELEALVSNEVSSLERAYSDNEVRIRALLDDIATQRENLAGQAEQVRNALSGVQIDLRQDISTISDSITGRVDEISNNISNALEERAEHITRSLTTAGDTMIVALGERGGDLLDRLEEASNRTAATVLDASENLTNAMNFKTGHVHEEFADLADRVHDMLNERLDRAASDFSQRSAVIIDDIAARTENVHGTIINSGETLLSQIDLRAADLANKIESAGDQLAERVLVSGDKASESLDATVNAMVEKVVSQTETAHEALSGQITSFEGLIKEQGAELAERFARDSGTLGALITRHVAEFDRTVKTYGGEIVERMGSHTQNVNDSLKGYIDSFDSRVTNHGETIHAKLDQRLTDFQNNLDGRVESLDSTLAGKAAALAEAIETRSTQLGTTMTARFQEMHDGLEIRFGAVSADIAARVGQFESLLDSRVEAAAARVIASGQNAADILVSRSEEMSLGIKSSANEAESALNEVASQLRSISNDVSRTVTTSTDMLGAALTGRIDAITEGLRNQTDQLSQMIDGRRGLLVEAIGSKSEEISTVISSATDQALKSIESHGGAFTVAMMNNSSDLARQINTASEVAIGAVNKSLKDIEESSRAAIDQSRQVAATTISELQETNKALRTDTLALFERLREGNILLQETLTGAHENLNTLERTLVTRVADFVTTMNDVTTKNGTSSAALAEQLDIFNSRTAGALDNLGSLAVQFESHGRALADAAHLIETSNISTAESVTERNTQLESLINTIDLRTLDMDERLHRFTTLLDQSLDAAEGRAREIAQVVAEAAGESSASVGRQFESVRLAVEDERRQTAEAMAEIYDQGTREADVMFRQSADKFASIVHSMKQMAAELHTELEATRAELRKGVLEMPQEAAESTSQMRKVIVDQIEALAELNRIVARHGRGLDVTTTAARVREEEPMMATAGARQESRPAPRPRDSGSSLPPPEFAPSGPRRTDAPPVAPNSDDRDGWLSNLLNRADGGDEPRGRGQRGPSGNPLEQLTLDITRLVDRDLASEMWERYQRGERKAFTKRLYTPQGQKAFEEVARKYRAERNFKATVDRYINEFEKLLDDVSRDERGPSALRNQLMSETGLVYTLLAHAAGRLG